jgi:NADH-quinone oxidoreductase subunit G
MEGSKKDIPSSLRSYYWHPGWNSVQALNKFQSETGGDMLHEDTGILLMHPETNIPGTYYSLDTIKKSDEDDLKLQVQSRIFGSEVLSNYSARVQEQIDEPFVLLHENEALKRGLKENDPVIIETGGKEYVFKLKVSDAMAEQLAVINPGSKSFIVPEIPCYSRVRKTKRA